MEVILLTVFGVWFALWFFKPFINVDEERRREEEHREKVLEEMRDTHAEITEELAELRYWLGMLEGGRPDLPPEGRHLRLVEGRPPRPQRKE